MERTEQGKLFDLYEPADVMYDPHLLAPPQERPRRTRSHSLKSMSQPNLLTPRTKRINSLPSKPVIPPYITIQGCHDIQDSHSDEEELRCDRNDSMAWYTPVVGLSCSLVMYAWSCALSYYSTTWRSGSRKREGSESADLVRMPEINPRRWKMV